MKRRTKTAKRNVTKCIRDVRLFPPITYRFDDDGRQWLHLCERRKALFLLLASFANGDGRSISVAINTLAEAQGWSRSTVCRLQEDFRKLGIMDDGELNPRYKNTRVRSCRVDRLQFLHEWQCALQENDTWVPSGVSSSISGVSSSPITPPKMTHNRLQTEVLTEEQNMDASQENAAQHVSQVPFDENEKSSDSSSSAVVAIPSKYFILLMAVIADWIGDRERWRDSGAIRSLWSQAVGSDDERYQRVSECLEAGKDYAGAAGEGIETLFTIAKMKLNPPSEAAGNWVDGL
jgi:hypothetical protein